MNNKHLTWWEISISSLENGNASLSVAGVVIWKDISDRNSFESALSEHPKNPIKGKKKQKLLKDALDLLDKTSFKIRRSGEDYKLHLYRSVMFYLYTCPNPTVDGVLITLHHDSFEDFPDKRYKLQRTIWIHRLRSVVALSKMPPHVLEVARKVGKFQIIVNTHDAVRNLLVEKSSQLNALEYERGLLRLALVAQQTFPVFSWFLTQIDDILAQVEGEKMQPFNIGNEAAHALWTMYEDIRISKDIEDLSEEVTLVVTLLQHATDDELYVKIGWDRIDNLMDIQYLHVMLSSVTTPEDLGKFNKLLRAREKMLATSRMYAFLARNRLQDESLAKIIELLIAWNIDKLNYFNAQLRIKRNEILR